MNEYMLTSAWKETSFTRIRRHLLLWGGEKKKKSLLPHISRRTIGMCVGGGKKKYTSACQHHRKLIRQMSFLNCL